MPNTGRTSSQILMLSAVITVALLLIFLISASRSNPYAGLVIFAALIIGPVFILIFAIFSSSLDSQKTTLNSSPNGHRSVRQKYRWTAILVVISFLASTIYWADSEFLLFLPPFLIGWSLIVGYIIDRVRNRQIRKETPTSQN
jgi:hypothetical protein